MEQALAALRDEDQGRCFVVAINHRNRGEGNHKLLEDRGVAEFMRKKFPYNSFFFAPRAYEHMIVNLTSLDPLPEHLVKPASWIPNHFWYCALLHMNGNPGAECHYEWLAKLINEKFHMYPPTTPEVVDIRCDLMKFPGDLLDTFGNYPEYFKWTDEEKDHLRTIVASHALSRSLYIPFKFTPHTLHNAADAMSEKFDKVFSDIAVQFMYESLLKAHVDILWRESEEIILRDMIRISVDLGPPTESRPLNTGMAYTLTKVSQRFFSSAMVDKWRTANNV
ncbi:hypothetical protein MMC06_004967 [Schaereria dolodes]|nr:hypothetical protein [Schaereria dolodes]